MTPADIEKIIWIFIALVTVGLLLAGLCNQCVIYYDAADVGVTFLGVCLPFFGAALLSPEVKPFDLELLNYVVRYGGGGVLILIGLWCFVLTFICSIRHNRSVLLGFIIGIYKVAFLLFSILALIGYFTKISDRSSTAREIFIATLLLLGFRVIAYAMINGERVYAAKGWDDERQIEAA